MKDKRVWPLELVTALGNDAGARRAFDAMPASHRAEYCRYIDDATKPETRERRARRAVEMITAWGKNRADRAGATK